MIITGIVASILPALAGDPAVVEVKNGELASCEARAEHTSLNVSSDCIFIRQEGDICVYWCDGDYEIRICG